MTAASRARWPWVLQVYECSMLQGVAGCCNLLFFLGYDCSTKGEVDASSGLQYVAVGCSELQCKAVDWHDFSKLSLLPNCPYTMSVKLTFENIYRVFV